MTLHPTQRFLGWLGHLWSADDARALTRFAKRETCVHGKDDPCPFHRKDFDCNDCDAEAGSGQMMPRM